MATQSEPRQPDRDERSSDESRSAEPLSPNIVPEQHDLARMIEESISASVRRDPRALADALFPVMGLAIRKATVATLATMTESLNRTVDDTFSWHALKWRWAAFKTGKPFADIVLLNTLNYRVEQLLLIHTETGLLLQHVSALTEQGDADQVSAMLTVIRDFVSDSFRVGADSLDALRVGELNVLIEQGPRAILAAVVRGHLPPEERVIFQDALEAIHREHGPQLRSFAGDATPFERSRQVLETCLIARSRQPGGATRSHRRLAILATALLLPLGAWLISDVRQRLQWNQYLERLSSEPGIVVVSSGRRSGRFFVVGLRDPLSPDPNALLDPNLRSQSDARWESYDSLAPPFVLARASRALRPPAGVTLDFHDGTLVAHGPAPERWIVESERFALALPGVSRFVHAPVTADERLKESIESFSISTGDLDHQVRVQELIRLLSELNDTMRLRGRRAKVDVVAHIDEKDLGQRNARQSREQAEALVRLLPAATLDALDIAARVSNDTRVSAFTMTEIPSGQRLSIRVQLQGGDTPDRVDR